MPVYDKVADNKWLDRVQALLNKAESTEFPEEAEALSAKAAEIMAKYAIDEMMLATAKKKGVKVEAVERVTIVIPAPYAKDRVYIAHRVAQAMECGFFYHPTTRDGRKTATRDPNHDLRAVLVGFPGDIERATFMIDSLYKQEAMARAAAKAAINDHSLGGKKVWNASFIRGYASRIGGRLADVYRKAEKEAQKTTSGVELALVDKRQKIKDATGPVRSQRSSAQSSAAGRSAGWTAGGEATLSQGVGGGSRGKIGG